MGGYHPNRLRCAIAAALALALACLLIPSPSNAEPGYTPKKWSSWGELGGYYGTDDTSRGEAALFATLMQGPNALLFADLRGKVFADDLSGRLNENDMAEGNLALGYRQMTAWGLNLGLWGGADVRNTEVDNTFWQVSGGLEALSPSWDFRVNGYVPVTDPKTSPSLARVFLTGNQILMTGGEEVPLYGLDGEVGYLLFGTGGQGSGLRAELRVFGGGFYFDDDDAIQEVAGPKARAELRIEEVLASLPGSRLTIEGEVSHDEVRDDKWELGARLRVPIGYRSRDQFQATFAALSPQGTAHDGGP